MAVIDGTSGNDIVHESGDGVSTVNFNDLPTATEAADTVTLGSGNDGAYLYGGNDTVTGDNGNDTIDGGTGSDNIDGGADNDLIIGGQGADVLNGGAGQDIFRFNALSDIGGVSEKIDGGDDYDKLDFSTAGLVGSVNLSTSTVKNIEEIDLSAGMTVTLTGSELGQFERIAGTFGQERFILSAAGIVDLTDASISLIDEFRGTSGTDRFTLTGVAEGQTVNGLGGGDGISGGLGGDRIDGSDGADTIAGSDGGDVLTGGQDVDSIRGDTGNDTIIGGTEADNLSGLAGDDSIVISLVGDVSGLAETISGGADTDRIDFQTQSAVGAVDLSHALISGIERIDFAGNIATLTAAQLSAIKTFNGSFGEDDIALAAAGNASFVGATFALIDKVIGSAGADGLNFSGDASAPFVDGGAGNDNITASNGNDSVFGNDDADTILGGGGNDTITGGQSTDSLSGGAGYDVFRYSGLSEISGLAEKIDGGADDDRIDFSTNGATGAINLTTLTIISIEQLSVNNNVVTLTAAQLSGFETIEGGFATERLILSAAGNVDLTGASLSLIDELRGTSGADKFTLTNVAQGQFVNALAGADQIFGGDGNDILSGGDGADVLSAAAGNDLLTGGLGADKLTGGTGADTFGFGDTTESPSSGRDTIIDFTHGQDIVDLGAIDANSESSGNQGFTFIGAAAFDGGVGELRYAAGVLSGDTNGDKVADFLILFTGSPGVTASDIVL